MGIIYRDPEDSYYDDAEFAIVKGNTVLGNLMDDVRFYGELALVREGIEKIHEALPDYKYVPMRDILLNDNVHEQQYHFFQATAELCHWYWL